MVVYALVDPTKTVTNLAADWETLAALIDDFIGGKITGGSARLILVTSGDEKSIPESDSRVEQTAVFDFPDGTSGRLYGVAVPSLGSSFITAGAVDLGPPVDAFVAAMTTPTANSQPTSNTYADLGALTDSFISFRKHRKQLTRSSYELPSP